ncbi:MAG: tetratricopeptide repeat protein [bacterium]|nr:tetratricopeptide repeat protein [bacterium]
MSKFPLKYLWLVALCAIGLQLTSCVYLNTYYNAKRYFREGVKENKDNETGQPRTTNYQKAINSAARVIQDYPKSGYVPDAIMIIGKAYYEMRNYPGAKRKFEELITNYPNSPLLYEARLYSAKTQIALRQPEEGITLLNDLYADEKTPLDVRIQGQRTLADYYYEKELYRQALSEYKKILNTSKDKVVRADIYFQIGECYFELGEFDQAQQNYQKVNDEKPTRKRQFEAIFKEALTHKEQQDLEGALSICEDLLKNDNYFPYYERVHLAKADILEELHRTEEAEALYKRTIELYPRTKTSAESAYHLGLIYLYDLNDFTKAEEFLGKVRSEQPQSEFVDTAQVKINDLRKLSTLNLQIDSLNTEIDTLNYRLSWIAEHPGGIDTDTTRADTAKTDTSSTNVDSLKQSAAPETPPGMLPRYPGQLTPEQIQALQARQQQQGELPGNFPSHLQPGTEPDYPGSQQPGGLNQPRQLRRTVVPLPTDSAEVYIWLERDQKALAEVRFRLAEHLWTQFDNLDSARTLLTDLVEKSEQSDVKARALLGLYHIAQITSPDSTGPDSLIQRLHDEYPETEFDRWARIKLGLDPLPEKVDSTSLLFHQAEDLWLNQNKPEEAVIKYEEVRKLYPKTEWGAKAAYAVAYVEEHIIDDIPAAKAAYDSLIVWYPDSPYLAIAQKKLAPPPPEIPDTTEVAQDTTGGAEPAVVLAPAPTGSGAATLIGGEEAVQTYIHQNHLFPPIALEATISGDVTISFIVDAAGLAHDFRVESEDPAGFDFGVAAINALKAMRYQPGYSNGQYEEQPLTERVRFTP